MNEKELTNKEKEIQTKALKEANEVHKDIVYIIKAVLIGSLIMFTGILIGFGI